MKDKTTYDKHHIPGQWNTGTTGVKHEDLNPWRKKAMEKVSESDDLDPNYSFIVPWQMY